MRFTDRLKNLLMNYPVANLFLYIVRPRAAPRADAPLRSQASSVTQLCAAQVLASHYSPVW